MDMGKQCRPRSGAAERGVRSGFPLFAYIMFHKNLNRDEKKNYPITLKIKMDLFN